MTEINPWTGTFEEFLAQLTGEAADVWADWLPPDQPSQGDRQDTATYPVCGQSQKEPTAL
jgi:hypothetical protein